MCKGAGSCTCIFIVSTGHCKCDCGPPIVLEPSALEPEERINLNVRNGELGEVADFIYRATRAEPLIPVSQLRNKVDLHLKDVTLADALDELGLVASPKQPPRPRPRT
jgi:hypothetical protein